MLCSRCASLTVSMLMNVVHDSDENMLGGRQENAMWCGCKSSSWRGWCLVAARSPPDLHNSDAVCDLCAKPVFAVDPDAKVVWSDLSTPAVQLSYPQPKAAENHFDPRGRTKMRKFGNRTYCRSMSQMPFAPQDKRGISTRRPAILFTLTQQCPPVSRSSYWRLEHLTPASD